jgi:hypothetical protein
MRRFMPDTGPNGAGHVKPDEGDISDAANVLFKYLRHYLVEYPPIIPAATEVTNVSEQQLRSYIYEGAIYVVVDPFAIWTLLTYGLDEQASLFGLALAAAGGRDGEVPSSVPGKKVHVWKMPTEGPHAITEATLRREPLH